MDLYTDPLDKITYADLEAWATQSPAPTESDRLDFKQEAGERVEDAIVGMSNRYGGVILVGVAEEADKGKKGTKRIKWPPVGISMASDPKSALASRCHQIIRPDYVPEHTLVDIPGTSQGILVIRVDVESAPRPLWHQEHGVRVRVGDQQHPADLDTLRRLLAEENRSPGYALFNQEAEAPPDNDCWIRCVVRASRPFEQFGSAEKQLLAHAVDLWFPDFDRSKDFYNQYVRFAGTSSSRYLLMERLAVPEAQVQPRRIVFHREGVYSSAYKAPAGHTTGEAIAAESVVDQLSRALSVLTGDELRSISPFASAQLEVRIDNLPPDGVVTGRWIHGTKWARPGLERTRSLRTDFVPLGRESIAQTIADFVSEVVADSGLVDFEDSLASYIKSHGWWTRPPA